MLQHYGVKGMRWGVRKKEETTGREGGRAKAESSDHQKAMVEMAVGTPIGSKSGMSNEKKAALALGVLAAAGGGYLAYAGYKNHMFMPGGKKPDEWDVSDLKHRPISDVDLTKGGFSEKYPSQAIHDTDFMTVDHSKGYADYTMPPNEAAGIHANPFADARHKDLTDTLDEMREKYPSIRNLKIEVLPMSAVPGMEGMQAMGAVAAVMPMGKGEARVLYNDSMDSFPEGPQREITEKFVPGMYKDKYVGYHEMGHLLAVANGAMPPLSKTLMDGPDFESAGGFARTMKTNLKYAAARSYYHTQLFKKHGFSFKELSKLGGYAATQPIEAMAELHGHYAHPEMRERLTPKQREQAKALFDEMGGLT